MNTLTCSPPFQYTRVIVARGYCFLCDEYNMYDYIFYDRLQLLEYNNYTSIRKYDVFLNRIK